MKTKMTKACTALALFLTSSGLMRAQICTGTQGAPIFNEDFGSGTAMVGPALPTGVTNYIYQSSGVPNNGTYVIANTGNPSSTTGYVNAGDHTGNTGGYMMVVNADVTANEAYRKHVTGLCPNTTYVFSAWLANNNTSAAAAGKCGGSTYIYANLKFQVEYPTNTVQNSVVTGNLPTAPTAGAFVWTQYGFAFTTTSGQTSADVVLINNAGGGCGNDYVVDDITLAPCGPGVAVSVAPSKTVFCTGESFTLQSTFTSGSYTSPQYQWQFSNDGGATWSNVSSATSQNYVVPSAAISQGGMYQLLVAENGNITSSNCRIVAGPLTFTVKDCGCCVGNACGDTKKNPLGSSWEVQLGNNNYVFNRTTSNTGKVGIGVVSCSPGNLLEVNKGSVSNVSGLRLTDLATATPLDATNKLLSINTNGDVILVNANGGISNACTTNNFVPKSNTLGNLACSQIFDDGTSVGVGTTTGFSYSSLPSSGLLQGATPPPTSGTIKLNVNGVTQSSAYFATSDQKFKKDILKIDNATDIIKKIEGKTYSWRTDEFKDKGFSTGRQYGFIAQELEKVVPEAVAIAENGDRSVSYDMIIPILVQSVKEQAAVIDNLQKQIDELKAVMQGAGAKTPASGSPSSQNVNLSDKTAIVLDQNVPNPFMESTVISYNIPVDFSKAQITFLTNDGKLIKTVDITTKGQNSLTVFAGDLSNGSYSYSLIVDGKVIETKRMIKQ